MPTHCLLKTTISFCHIWEVLRTQELTGVYCTWEKSKDLKHWSKLPPPSEHFSNPRGGTSSLPSIIFSHTVCMCSAFHHQLSVCREALERRRGSLERIKSKHGRGGEQKRKEENHPHKPKYILSNFHAESWQGKGVNKNEFTRTQFSYIYNNMGTEPSHGIYKLMISSYEITSGKCLSWS